MNELFTPLYMYSAVEAKRRNEVAQWRESHQTNIFCKRAIENEIRKSFDGINLNGNCAANIIDQFGYKRVWYVLAATLQQMSYDGRFSPNNKQWSREIYIAEDLNYTCEYTISSHPAVLNGFVDQFRKELASLHMFGPNDCETIWQELQGKVLVMKPDTLKESYWAPVNQLWVATGGFGCSPTAAGRAVYATCLGDGESNIRWNREDFYGVIKDELLPDWAREQLYKFQSGQVIGPVTPASAQTMQL